MFAETDCPFLAPQEKRGERNEPAYVVSVVEKIAEIQGLSINGVKQSIETRVKEIFGV
ncbi:MAG: TatD family hydrolase [Candidatus Moraniibacteriota bacterium]